MVRSCLLIYLIKCLKGHKSLGSLCSVVNALIVSLVRATKQPTKGRTMSPIELFWTAKNEKNEKSDSILFDNMYHSQKCIYECNAKIVSEVIFLGLYAKGVSDLNFGHCINNDTPFMNPSSHPHLSVNQQEHSSSRRGARLKLSPKNVQWRLPLFPSFPGLAEHQACWMKNSY